MTTRSGRDLRLGVSQVAVVCVLLGTHATTGALAAEDAAKSPSDDSGRLVSGWLRVCKSHAEAYVIRPAEESTGVFKLIPDPVFRHSQPVRGDDIGAVWFWVDENGRPGAVGTIFAYSGGAGVKVTVSLRTSSIRYPMNPLSRRGEAGDSGRPPNPAWSGKQSQGRRHRPILRRNGRGKWGSWRGSFVPMKSTSEEAGGNCVWFPSQCIGTSSRRRKSCKTGQSLCSVRERILRSS